MAKFETPINNPQVAAALNGLDAQSVLLARSFDQSSRLNAFIDQYVEPDTLEYETEQGIRQFDMGRLSAIGQDGSLLHIRLQRQAPMQSQESSFTHMAVISHIDDPNPAIIHAASSEDIVRFDGTRKTTFTIGSLEEPGLQSIDAPMNELQWGVEKVLARELALAARPLVRVTMNEWEYRRSDRHWEKLSDIYNVRARVSRALTQGLGYAALPIAQPEEQPSYGQLGKKMVV